MKLSERLRIIVETELLEADLNKERENTKDIRALYEQSQAESAALKKVIEAGKRANEELKARIKALEANTSKSVLRRLEAQFTGGTTPTYFGEQEKE